MQGAEENQEGGTMNILKQGEIPEYLQTVKRFKCYTCGCVFEADKGEYESEFYYNEIAHRCKCPCCGVTADSVPKRSD